MTRKAGAQAEKLAYNFLIKKKLTHITRNYHSKYGEIDLVMLDNLSAMPNLIFVEVKYRKDNKYYHPIEAVDTNKRIRMLNTAFCFLEQNPKYSKLQYRFDAVTIISRENNFNASHTFEIDWFRNIITS